MDRSPAEQELNRIEREAVLVFADRLSSTSCMQLKAGSIGGAVGLLLGYGVGRLRP